MSEANASKQRDDELEDKRGNSKTSLAFECAEERKSDTLKFHITENCSSQGEIIQDSVEAVPLTPHDVQKHHACAANTATYALRHIGYESLSLGQKVIKTGHNSAASSTDCANSPIKYVIMV
ncbi:hypothetical protein HELRODRAFT_161051 [Helobdella robusta]|uniref:Uncharacterized protein n=1 Tax=Helobdella robusta TaxID=6412 RepID=T1ER24_HELRO|nr:hypothetical protein HELRODRAFT_161051 [Helobdella robusta]ESO01873.1 hypothetical protein HELRODRAFT_161051 [Helobdella robusta]